MLNGHNKKNTNIETIMVCSGASHSKRLRDYRSQYTVISLSCIIFRLLSKKTKIRNLKMYFYISFQYKKLKLKTMKITSTKTILNPGLWYRIASTEKKPSLR